MGTELGEGFWCRGNRARLGQSQGIGRETTSSSPSSRVPCRTGVMPILQRGKQRLREARPPMYLPAGVLGLKFTQTAGGCSLPAHLLLWLGMQRWMPCFCTLSYCFPELAHRAHLWKSQGLPGQEGRLPGIITASHVNSILSHSPCLSPEEKPGPGSGTFSHYWL